MNCQAARTAIDERMRQEGLGEPIRAHLDGCPDCRQHTRELSSLFSLLKAQPVVEAPRDFDFKLRARIARAKAAERETAVTPLRWFEKLWAGSFSWAQATTALAAIAIMVSVSTYQIYRNNDATLPAPAAQATVIEETASAPAGATVETAAVVTPFQSTARAEMGRTARRSAQPTVVSDKAIRSAERAMGEADRTWRAFNRERGQLITTPQQSTLLGADGAGSTGKLPAYVPSI